MSLQALPPVVLERPSTRRINLAIIDAARIGANIRARRKLVGLTLNAAADLMDMGASYLGHLELGKSPRISLESIGVIATALDCTVLDLLALEAP